MRARTLLLATTVVAAGALLAWIALRPSTITDIGPLTLPADLPEAPEGAEVLLAVGDIGSCQGEADEAVAELAGRLPGTIALLGDTVYPVGSPQDFASCFAPAWGPMRERLRPAIGNHEYETSGAAGYFGWFGDAAGEPGQGWYSYDLGAWHVVVFNSNCAQVSCAPGSPQLEWLEVDLAASDAADCLLAYWHHPRWSSGRHGSTEAVEPLWSAAVSAGVDVVLNGHDHSYERVEVEGVQQFVVGTGGRSLYRFDRDPLPETRARHDATYGLLWLSLGEGSYRWEFLPVGITTFSDAGEGSC